MAVVFRQDYHDCLSRRTWLLDELDRAACNDLPGELMALLQLNQGRLGQATNDQDALLDDLYPFKMLNGEDEMTYRGRVRMEFDDAIDHRMGSRIDVPYVPDLCADAQGPLDALNDFIMQLEEELTFVHYLEIAVEGCCDDLLEWTLAGQDTA
jgi:hypothetical protein